jgi:hypothetical protein
MRGRISTRRDCGRFGGCTTGALLAWQPVALVLRLERTHDLPVCNKSACFVDGGAESVVSDEGRPMVVYASEMELLC